MFLKDLVAHDRGLIVCCNIVDGLDAGLYEKSFVRGVFDWWEALCHHEKITDTDKRIDRLRNLAFDAVLGLIPTDFRPTSPRPGFSFFVKKMLRPVDRKLKIASVLPAHYLGSKISDGDLDRFVNTLGVDFPVDPTAWKPDIIERLQKLPAADRTFLMRKEPLHPYCLWYTREDILKSRLTSANPSNAARDALGLVHYGHATPLAALYFGYDDLGPTASHRPTFVEAGDHRRYKARVTSKSSKRRTAWGYTVDLEELETSTALIDGCPERIARPTPLSCQVEFEILGTTSGVRGEPLADSDNTFARLLVERSAKRKRTDKEVESYLRSCL